ncbi:S8 family serine peptidase, partial [bacterium]|nr:S8 family serine peptidase [bacterium]
MRARLLPILLSAALLILFTGMTAVANPQARLDDWVIEHMQNAQPDEHLPIVVLMAERPDIEHLHMVGRSVPRSQRSTLVWSELQDLVQRTQGNIKNYLHKEMYAGGVTFYQSIHVCNGIKLEATPRVIYELAERQDVYLILDDHNTGDTEPMVPSPPRELDDVSWSVDFVNARGAWAQGFTGEGILVAVFDSGVRYTHNDLEDHMWDGGAEYPNHGYDFLDNDNDPWDTHGHGTNCAGHVAGDGTTNGDTVGVAPDATIMAVRAIGSRSAFWSGMDFAVAQSVDIISTALAFYTDNNNHNLRATWRENFDVLHTAGVITAKSAGNSRSQGGPYSQLSTPAGVPSPWRHPDEVEAGGRSSLISVAAVESDYTYAYYSSGGPTSWELATGYNDYLISGTHVGMIFPDVSGPAGNGYTLSHTSDNGFIYDFSGTSMATPHLGGVLALMYSKNPDLELEEADSILQTTAMDLGPDGKDNDYGAGLAQADLAVEAVVTTTGWLEVTVTDEYTGETLPGIGVYMERFGRQIEYTNENGFISVELSTGEYIVGVDSILFEPLEITDVQIDSADTTTLDLALVTGYFEADPDSIAMTIDNSSNGADTTMMWVYNRGGMAMDILMKTLPYAELDDYLDVVYEFDLTA